MFRGLRLRLSLLYTLAALALLALVGGGAYAIVARYFAGVTDLALQHKMAHEFHALAAPLPPELAHADRDWSLLRAEAGLLARPRRAEVVEEEEEDDDEHERHEAPPATTSIPDAAELAAIIVLPLDRSGRVLFRPDDGATLEPDLDALSAALRTGSDLRTVETVDGRRVRLLTYRLTRPDGPAALQLGRELGDQERVLAQLLSGLLGLGMGSLVLIGGASWWLAGRALRPAQEGWERQQRFIASASHELRAPLTLLRASAEMALRGLPTNDNDRRELLADVLGEADHMRRLVDDLLTLSRIDSGHFPLDRQPVELAPLLTALQREVARIGAQRGVEVRLGHVAGRALGDVERIRQVLLILLDNALRHTPAQGQVTLAAVPSGRTVRLQVEDTGCGIAPEHLPHIFERFYRADSARGRASEHAGLGLSIAHGLVEAMGGRITVSSRPGRGTTVTVTLPAG